jgi:hypothetical protein
MFRCSVRLLTRKRPVGIRLAPHNRGPHTDLCRVRDLHRIRGSQLRERAIRSLPATARSPQVDREERHAIKNCSGFD